MPAVKYMYNHELFSTDTQRVCINQGCAKPNLGSAKLSGFGFVCPWSKWFLSWFQEKTDKGEKSLKIQKKAQKNARIPIKNAGFAYKNTEIKGFFVVSVSSEFARIRSSFVCPVSGIPGINQTEHPYKSQIHDMTLPSADSVNIPRFTTHTLSSRFFFIFSPSPKIARPANKHSYKHSNSNQVEKAADKQPVNELNLPRLANQQPVLISRFKDRPTNVFISRATVNRQKRQLTSIQSMNLRCQGRPTSSQMLSQDSKTSQQTYL